MIWIGKGDRFPIGKDGYGLVEGDAVFPEVGLCLVQIPLELHAGSLLWALEGAANVFAAEPRGTFTRQRQSPITLPQNEARKRGAANGAATAPAACYLAWGLDGSNISGNRSGCSMDSIDKSTSRSGQRS